MLQIHGCFGKRTVFGALEQAVLLDPMAFQDPPMLHQAGPQKTRHMIFSESISAKITVFEALEKTLLLHPWYSKIHPWYTKQGSRKPLFGWERATQTMCSIASEKKTVRIQSVENLGDQNKSATQDLVWGGVAPQVGHVYIIKSCRSTSGVAATVSRVALHCDTKNTKMSTNLL